MGYFDNLKLDTWFKPIAYLGGIIALLSLTIPIQIASNESVGVFGFGMFLYGIGRWKNRKTFTQFVRGGKLSQKRRSTDLIGLFLEVSGIVLVFASPAYVIYTIF